MRHTAPWSPLFELELELVHYGDLGRAFAPFQYFSAGLVVCVWAQSLRKRFEAGWAVGLQGLGVCPET